MPNPYFRFKKFTIYHDRTAMKVTTDACLFGAWCANIMNKGQYLINNTLEIGTGTALLSLMIAQKNDLEIDAVEIDADAVAQAKENVADTPWKDKIHIHHSDIMHFDPKYLYDCIFSNPPFYENEIESANKKKNIAHHGHGLKLDALYGIISRHLKENGIFFLLLPFKRVAEIEYQLGLKKLTILKKTVVRQSVNHQPFRLMLMGSKNKQETTAAINEISICDENKQYTPEFIELLKDYYLYL